MLITKGNTKRARAPMASLGRCGISLRNLAALLAGRPVKNVLEVGCGTGRPCLPPWQREASAKSHVGVDVADPNEHKRTLLRQHYN